MRTESLTDPLAALANRKFYNVELGKAIAEAKQCGEPQTLLMCDADHSKALKRQIRAGDRDQVLRLVAMSMKQNVKGQDIAARYGGEDFIVALPKASLPQAITVADSACRHDEGTDETIERRTSRSGNDFHRGGDAAGGRHAG